MRNPIKSLIDELQTRYRENKELKLAVLRERERIWEERGRKGKSKIRKIGFIDDIADKISTGNDERIIKKFEENKKKELAIARERRKENYRGDLFVLAALCMLFVVVAVTIAAISENGNDNSADNEVATEYETVIEALNTDSDRAEEEQTVEVNTEDVVFEEKTTSSVDNNDMNEQKNEVSEGESGIGNLNTEVVKENNLYKTSNSVDETYQEEYMVWIPTNGGNKYHSKSTCSKMRNPKQVTQTQAEKMGYKPCKRCR